MTFKNKRGEVHWYVIALLLAVLVLLVSIGVIIKIKNAQGQIPNDAGCTTLGATCEPGQGTGEVKTSCPDHTTKIPVAGAACPTGKYCCKADTP